MDRTYISDTKEKTGEKVKILGRVLTVRDHGKLSFFDIGDETAFVQTVCREKLDVGEQDIVELVGLVKKRPDKLINEHIETGGIEIEVEKLKIISHASTPPIPVGGDGYEIDEELRLKYRYLDLRRDRLQKNLRLRHKIGTLARDYLNKEGFVEIETPYLSQTTPEGSRDFLVPSRKYTGSFYALTQSPQQYKQLLMLAGFEKYYQFARCFRDEDLRADRQFEHTQIDIEMAFVNREDIMRLIENLYKGIAESLGLKIYKDPFPVLTYKEAMEKYGKDKFDMRQDKNSKELAFAWVVDFPLLEYDKQEKRYTFSHNPFCSPKEEDLDALMKGENLDNLLSNQYDLVLNGEEIAGGSIRITAPEVQKQVFKVMGYSEQKIKDEFGHLLDAYEYGAPVHGGIALGLDRFCAMVSGESSIREVIAFPGTGSGKTAVMSAPSKVDDKTLKELGLKLR